MMHMTSPECGKARQGTALITELAGDCIKKITCKSTLECTVLVLGLTCHKAQETSVRLLTCSTKAERDRVCFTQCKHHHSQPVCLAPSSAGMLLEDLEAHGWGWGPHEHFLVLSCL